MLRGVSVYPLNLTLLLVVMFKRDISSQTSFLTLDNPPVRSRRADCKSDVSFLQKHDFKSYNFPTACIGA